MSEETVEVADAEEAKIELNSFEKKVFILRGLPGTGKTELSKYLVNQFSNEVIYLSSDDFFYNAQGEFDFDNTKIKDAHKWNFARFKQAIEDNATTIIIDNSNVKRYNYFQYIDYAQRHDYQAIIIVLPHNDLSDRELEARTPHNISRSTIRKMREMFEWEI